MSRLRKKLDKIGNDPKSTAKAVGLRYFPQSSRGFYRRRHGKSFRYLDQDGITLKDPETLHRINALVIPPAWEDVWISPYENGHLQVTGIDTKGRKQYRYHADWNKIRNQSKFYRLRRFAEALPAIRERTERDLGKNGLPYEKVLALVVTLIEQTNIRIGNDAYKKLYGSFGLTTLRDRHVKFDKSEVRFEFTGKKGVKHNISLKSRKLANLVRKCQEIPGQELFQYYDQENQRRTIGSGDVNAYIKEISGQDFTAKDFRAWAGSVHALCGLRDAGPFDSMADCKRKVVAVIDSVAEKLGNTRTVCRKYYIDPIVIATYENGSLERYCDVADQGKLTPEEQSLVCLLENEKIAEVVA